MEGKGGGGAPRNSSWCGGPKAALAGERPKLLARGRPGVGDVPGALPAGAGGPVPLGLEPSASGKREGGVEEGVARKVPFST